MRVLLAVCVLVVGCGRTITAPACVRERVGYPLRNAAGDSAGVIFVYQCRPDAPRGR